MQYEYIKSYRSRHISHNKLYNKIVKQFKENGDDVEQLRFYDELLFILDERSPSTRASRGVCDQLYKQTHNADGKSSLSKMVWAYIQNLQTAKLCLLRDESKIGQLKQRQGSVREREATYVHLQIIQVSVYSRFTKDAILSYSIQPSNIPPVTLGNAINPLLNHEFTFKLQNEDKFSILFMDSGICIGQWTFPDQQGLPEGEYQRLIKSQNVTFQVKIKYLPKHGNGQKQIYNSEIKQFQDQRKNSREAFQNLVSFEPFLNRQTALKQVIELRKEEQLKQQQKQGQIMDYGECAPILQYHVRNLYIMLLSMMLGECLFAYYSSIEFIDMIIAFYLMGIMQDREIKDYSTMSMQFLIICVSLVLCIVKSFWGLASPPFYVVNGVKVFMAILCVILKVGVIIALTICMNNTADMAMQRDTYFYKGQRTEVETPVHVQPPLPEDNIWEDQPQALSTR